MPYAKAKDGTMLYHKDWGEGRPVVLLHGWPLTGDSFDDMAIALAERGFRSIVPDRRGFGRSPDLALRLRKLVEQLGLRLAPLASRIQAGNRVLFAVHGAIRQPGQP